MGRPSLYSEKVADEICEQIVEGKSLRSICRAKDMPSASSVFKWLRDNEEFSQQYARAKEEQAEALADEIIDIADGKKAKYEEGEADVNRDRLAVDARKWVASKLKPKKYGDSQTLRHADADGEKLELDDVGRATRLAAIFADIEARKNSDERTD